MYQQIPGQNQQIYIQNYGIPLNQNPNKDQYINPVFIQNPQNIQHIPNAGRMSGGGKRKSFPPAQYQKEKMVFQAPQLIPNQQPQQKNVDINSGNLLNLTTSPIQGFQPQYPQAQGITPPQNLNPQLLDPQQQQDTQQPNIQKTATFMTVNTLSNIPYSKYEKAEYSHRPFYNISGYGFNSYNGKVRGYNEDRTKTIVNYQKQIIVNGKKISPRISYFAVFDGHGGEGCSNFLKDKLHTLLFNSKYFPAYPIQAVKEAFINAENIFMQQAIDPKSNSLVDKSGSCACISLIINDTLYAINLGDCRALLSTDSGQTLRQITRDHKPNDHIERKRIEKSGAKVYYANKVIVNGKEVVLKEKDYGVESFPYRINPGGISVSFFYNFLGSKNYWGLLC